MLLDCFAFQVFPITTVLLYCTHQRKLKSYRLLLALVWFLLKQTGRVVII